MPSTDRPRRAGQETPTAPAMPSFASLRAPRQPSPVDVLVPGARAEPPVRSATPVPAPVPSPAPAPIPSLPSTAPAAGPSPARVPASPAVRPPEWADLALLGVHVARSLAGLPVRLLRRLLGA